MIVCEVDQLVRNIHHILQLIGEHTAVPECPLSNVLLGYICRRLLLEGLDSSRKIGAFRDNVAVFFAGIGRLDAHKNEVRFPLLRLLGQPLQCFKVVILYIRIYRTDHHGLLRVDMLHIHQICRSQRDGRECVPAAGLDRDSHFVSQLVMDSRYLRLACGDGHSSIRVCLLDLTIDTLHHRFIGTVLFLENLNELLGTDIIGQRPKAFAGTAG